MMGPYRIRQATVADAPAIARVRVEVRRATYRKSYETLGGRLIHEERQKHRGAPVDMVAYGWEDLSEFLKIS